MNGNKFDNLYCEILIIIIIIIIIIIYCYRKLSFYQLFYGIVIW